MKVRSGHLMFSKKVQFKDLIPVYKEMYMKFLEETNQVCEDPETTSAIIETNMLDLRNNRKPEGFNRVGNMRMIFPITDDSAVQFYIYGQSKSADVARVTETISKFLQKKGFDHEVQWDRMLLYREKEK